MCCSAICPAAAKPRSCARFPARSAAISAACSETLHAERRSVVHITHASLQAGDGFVLSACHRFAELDHPVRFAVYPRLMQADVRLLTRQLPIPLPSKAAGRKA